MIGRCPECGGILEKDGYCEGCEEYFEECIKDDYLTLCPYCHEITDLTDNILEECPYCHEIVDEFHECKNCEKPLTVDGKPWTCEICGNGQVALFRCPNCNEIIDNTDKRWACPNCNREGGEPYIHCKSCGTTVTLDGERWECEYCGH